MKRIWDRIEDRSPCTSIRDVSERNERFVGPNFPLFDLKKRGIPFNLEFRLLFKSLRQRLLEFKTAEACGRWNSVLCHDIATDVSFLRNAEHVHEIAIHDCFPIDCPVSDGLAILGVGIDHGSSIWVNFQIWLFVDRNGSVSHSAFPSRLTVTQKAGFENRYIASLGCGLRDARGRFWYPRNAPHHGRYDFAPEHEGDWAFWYSKELGDASISGWLANRDD